MRIVIWSVLGWLAIIPVAIANGALREFVLVPWLGLGFAQPLSGLLLIACIGAVVWFLIGRIGERSRTSFVAIGVLWGLATFLFETAMVFGQGHSWDRVAQQYSFADNNLWPLVMLWVIVAPLSVAWLRGRIITPG